MLRFLHTTWVHPHNAGRKKIMSSFPKAICVWALCLGACLISADAALGQALPLPSPPKAAPNGTADPLGRATPSGTMLGFLQAAQAGDYGIAAQYLQLNPARRQSEGEQLATKLKVVLDQAFTGRFNNFTQSDGVPQEGVPLGWQKLGTLSSGDVQYSVQSSRALRSSPGTAGREPPPECPG